MNFKNQRVLLLGVALLLRLTTAQSAELFQQQIQSAAQKLAENNAWTDMSDTRTSAAGPAAPPAMYAVTTEYQSTTGCSGATLDTVYAPTGECFGPFNAGGRTLYMMWNCAATNFTQWGCATATCGSCMLLKTVQFTCAPGNPTNPSSIGSCVTSLPPLPSSSAQLAVFSNAACTSTPGIIAYQTLADSCVNTFPNFRQVSSCTSTTVAFSNCTDGACAGNCGSFVWSDSTCATATGAFYRKLVDARCPNAASSFGYPLMTLALCVVVHTVHAMLGM